MSNLVIMFFLLAVSMLLIGVPVSVTIGAASLFYIFAGGIQHLIAIQKVFAGINMVALLAIPFFVLAGDLMNTGGIASRLVDLASITLGRRTGGLATVTIVGCMFFAAISGSGVATAAALGSIMIPAMIKNGYNKGFATSVVATASPIGVIIPPSISFVLYGVMTGTSIVNLYLAGIPAGIMMGLALIIISYFTCRKNGYTGTKYDMPKKELRKAKRKAWFGALWALGTPIILIGGVFGGIFTPTESAVAAVVYAIFVGIFVYKDMKFKDLPRVFLNSAKMSGRILFIIANAALFAYVLTYEKIPQMIVQGLLGITTNKIMLLLIINIILLIAGTFMETGAIIIIMTPLLLPIIQQLGMDLTHFGIIITVNTAIGLVTPPFGVCLFTSAAVAGMSVQALARRLGVFLIAMVIVLMIITYLPQTVLFLL